MIEHPRVLLDATSIPPSHGGVARFIAGLLEGLEAGGVRLEVVAKRDDIPGLAAVAPTHRYIVAPRLVSFRPLRLLWEQLGLPALARRRGCAVIHSPHYTFPLVSRSARVVTLHDATFFSAPDAHSRLKSAFFRSWIRLANARAERLVAVSQATVSEVRRFVPDAQTDIAVGYLGVDTAVFSPPTAEAIAAVRGRIGLASGSPWIAFLGTIEPRKNVPALLEAHGRLRSEDPTAPPLVLSGARGWDEAANAALDGIAAQPPAARGVIEAGYLPLDLLSAFLGGAELVVYPSLGEGFGLPVLEAMASGTAVLTTRRLSIPEVGGDAVAYTEPDADSLLAAMRGLLADAGHREQLAAHGLERSRGFTWQECGRVYAEVYGSAAEGVSR